MAGIAIAIAFGVTRAAGDSELTRGYLDLAFDVAKTEQETALAFSSMIENIEDFDRAAMIKLLERLEDETEGLVDELDTADPPELLQEGHLFLRIAVTTWRGALSDSKLGLIALTEFVLDEDGLATLTRGLVDLRVGDSAYVGFLSSLIDVDTELQGGDPPIVAFVPAALEGLFNAQELARRLFLTENLSPFQNVAVADLRLEPGSVGERRGDYLSAPARRPVGDASPRAFFSTRSKVSTDGKTSSPSVEWAASSKPHSRCDPDP